MFISKNIDQRISLTGDVQIEVNHNKTNKIAYDIIGKFNRSAVNLKLKTGDRFIFEAKCSKTNENILYAAINVGRADNRVIKHFIYMVDGRSFDLNVSLPLTPDNVIRNDYFCTIEGQIKWFNREQGEQIRTIFCNAVDNAVVKVVSLDQIN